MKKHTVWILAALMAIALLGVCGVQFYYVKQSYVLKSQLFDQTVNQTLQNVVDKYQKHQIANYIGLNDSRRKEERILRRRQIISAYEKAKAQEESRLEMVKIKREREIEDYLNFQDSLIRTEYIEPIIISESTYKALLLGDKSKARLTFNIQPVVDDKGNMFANVQRNFESSEKTYKLNNTLPDTIRYLANDKITGGAVYIELPKVPKELADKFRLEDKIHHINHANDQLLSDTSLLADENFDMIKDVASEMQNQNAPFKNRVNLNLIDSLIKTELLVHNLPQEYAFSITSSRHDSLFYSVNVNHLTQNLASKKGEYTTPLFKSDIFRDPGMLRVYLPNKNTLILNNIKPTLLGSAGLILILLLVFTYTLVSIVKQKKLTEMKIDFINNMTHEFKTPVSTIMIASESLRDVELNKDTNRVQRLANIIFEENVRLGHNIERVLNIAKLEKNSLELSENPVELNSLVDAVVDSMQLQLQKNNAKITLQLTEEECTVKGDELHLSNIIFNLIDNALKYSVGNPEIEIYTQKTPKNVIFTIKDYGIGMTKDQQKRIFDQFYRVPTGNLHDVKGFGLGLNYVQYVVKQMNGKIKIKSEKDKGSQFEITFPV